MKQILSTFRNHKLHHDVAGEGEIALVTELFRKAKRRA